MPPSYDVDVRGLVEGAVSIDLFGNIPLRSRRPGASILGQEVEGLNCPGGRLGLVIASDGHQQPEVRGQSYAPSVPDSKKRQVKNKSRKINTREKYLACLRLGHSDQDSSLRLYA